MIKIFMVGVFINISNIGVCQKDIYIQLRKKVDQNWKPSNLQLEKTETSFFNTKNIANYLIVPVEIKNDDIMFAWDCELSILKYLVSFDSNYKISSGEKADVQYKGTKLNWPSSKPVLIWCNNATYTTTIKYWHLMEVNECPGSLLMPFVEFEKIKDLQLNNQYKAMPSDSTGIAIISKTLNFTKIKQSAAEEKTVSGKVIKGTAYDLNQDDINDVFVFFEWKETFEEGKGFRRLYLNVEGEWKCKWIEFYEECRD